MTNMQTAEVLERGARIIEFGRQQRVRGAEGALRIVNVSVDDISVRREGNAKESAVATAELVESVRRYGVMQPISVRKGTVAGQYELVSGARRLWAARLAGLGEIPAVVYDIDESDSAVMGLIESLQSDSLDYIEEAEAYFYLMEEHGITQEELAYRVGKSQSTIANKIRLLKLPPLVKKIIHDRDLSERHARALLRIRDEQLQLKTLRIVCKRLFNVSKTEQLVTKVLEKRKSGPINDEQFDEWEEELSGDSYQVTLAEIKAFINDLRKNVEDLRRAGVVAKAVQFDREEYLEFVVRIPKAENGMKKRPENVI